MTLNPIRLLRRFQRLRLEAVEEASVLRAHYGERAAEVAREKLTRPNLTSWYRKVIERALRHLEAQRF